MILDANIAVKWVLAHPDSEQARVLMRRRDLRAPSSLLVEAAHALTRAKRDRLLSADQVRLGYAIIKAPVEIVDAAMLVEPAIELSLALHANVNDCVYLALALREDDVLVTADQRFLNAVRASAAHARFVAGLGD